MATVIDRIAALEPRNAAGHQFVLYADSCSGRPGAPEEGRHAAVTDVIRRLTPAPEFISFPGDAVMDGGDPVQWNHWINHEMSWIKDAGLRLFPSTSNHHTYDDESVRLFRASWPDLPQNGPQGQHGLAYHVRTEDLLYVSLHQPEPSRAAPMQCGLAATERDWIENVLAENDDAEYVVVAGHYPVFPVNGYREAPMWCFTPEAGEQLWRLLRAHRVSAYLCSHVIAFDVQAHDGILQITSGRSWTPSSWGLS